LAAVLATDNISSDGPFNDDEDLDNDASTDKYVSANWASLFGSWPGELPASLLTINFNTAEDADTTTIGFSSVSNASGYAFAPEAYEMPINTGSWDFDADGNADALTDGMLLLRYAFGLRGELLVSNAMAEDSQLSHSEIQNNLISAHSYLDIDNDGDIGPLTDGLMLLRYLFGLEGEMITNQAVGPSASRGSHEEIQAYLEAYMPAM
jgi:hypothetical protein